MTRTSHTAHIAFIVALLGLTAITPQDAFGQGFFQTVQTWISDQQPNLPSARAGSETRYKNVSYTVSRPVYEPCYKEFTTTCYRSESETCHLTVFQTPVTYTVTKQVPYTVVTKVPYTVVRMVEETITKQVPYTVTRMVNESQIQPIPDTGALDKALEQLRLQPRDPYLQYVVLQLARRADKLAEVGGQVEAIVFDPATKSPNRRTPVGLFGLFVGSKDPLERLQLEAMLDGVTPQTPSNNGLLSLENLMSGNIIRKVSETPAPTLQSDEAVAASRVPDGFIFGPDHDQVRLPDGSVVAADQPSETPADQPAINPSPEDKSPSFPQAVVPPDTTSVCKITATWERHVYVTEDTANGGPLAGLMGRLYLFDKEVAEPLVGNGSVVVDLYDDNFPGADGKAVHLEQWHIDSVTLRKLVTKDPIGQSYTLFLPWKSNRPELTQLKVKVCYKEENRPPLYSVSQTITISHGDPLAIDFIRADGDPAPVMPPVVEDEEQDLSPTPSGPEAWLFFFSPNTESAADRKLRQAFGPEGVQVQRTVRLEIRKRGLVLATDNIKIEPDGRLKLTPISVALFAKNQNDQPFPEITTIESKAAYLAFEQPINNLTEIGSRKIVGWELEGNVHIINNRGSQQKSDDLEILIDDEPLFYEEKQNKIWTDGSVLIGNLQTGPSTKITAKGMELFLAPHQSRAEESKTGTVQPLGADLGAVEMVVLREWVEMHLYADSSRPFPTNPTRTVNSREVRDQSQRAVDSAGKNKPDTFHLIIRTPGKFTFDTLKNVATFENVEKSKLSDFVTVFRVPLSENDIDSKYYDQLMCDCLKLVFRNKGDRAVTTRAFDFCSADREIDSAHATSRPDRPKDEQVILIIDKEHLHIFCSELFYDAPMAPSPTAADSKTPTAGSSCWIPCIPPLPLPPTVPTPTPEASPQVPEPPGSPSQAWNRPSWNAGEKETETNAPMFGGKYYAPPPPPPLPPHLVLVPHSEAPPQVEEPTPEVSKYKEIVDLTELTPPDFTGQPWAELLGDKKVEVSSLSHWSHWFLSRCVPADFYFAEFSSVAKLLQALDTYDQWGQYLALQTTQTAATKDTKNRILHQLGLSLPTLEWLEKNGTPCGVQVAITGSESFLGEAGDVTVLYYSPMVRVPCGMSPQCAPHSNPDGSMSYYAANPWPGLHIFSTSKAALQRVLEAFAGKDAAGNPVQRLGDTAEFQYVRSLLKQGDTEDGFLYFPEAFQKRLASPALQIAQQRRQLAHAHLRMIGHAAQMYRSEQGRLPESLGTLAFAGCVPGAFNEGRLRSPGSGQYSLATDGLTGVSDVYGRADALTPCIDLPPFTEVTAAEAEAYDAFVANFKQSGRAGVNPIALRLQLTDKRIHVEAFTPPPTGDPLYDTLAKVLGGEPEYLDTLPVPKRNLFSLNVRINKQKLLRQLMDAMDPKQNEKLEALQQQAALVSTLHGQAPFTAVAWALVQAYDWYLDEVWSDRFPNQQPNPLLLSQAEAAGLDKEQLDLVASLEAFLNKGIGNQIGLHLYDAAVPIDVNLPACVEQLLNPGEQGTSMMVIAPLAGAAGAALTSPVYLSIPVKDAAVVDAFLDKLDKVAQPLVAKTKSANFWGAEVDLYRCLMAGSTKIHTCSLRFGPLRYRVYWGRIGDGLYIANSPVVFQDLQEAQRGREVANCWHRLPWDCGPKAQAMVRLRPQHWDLALPGFRMGWAENHRIACIHNLGPLSSTARTLCGNAGSWDDRQRQVHACAGKLYGKSFSCPEGGRYELTEDGKAMTCSIHGSALEPRQPLEPAADSTVSRLMQDLTDVTAAITFAPEGLRLTLTIERK